jgi:hypothetical protein
MWLTKLGQLGKPQLVPISSPDFCHVRSLAMDIFEKISHEMPCSLLCEIPDVFSLPAMHLVSSLKLFSALA